MTLRERLQRLVEEAIDNYDIDGHIEDWFEEHQGCIIDRVAGKITDLMNEAIDEHLDRYVDMTLDEVIDSCETYGYAISSIEEELD